MARRAVTRRLLGAALLIPAAGLGTIYGGKPFWAGVAVIVGAMSVIGCTVAGIILLAHEEY